MRRRALLALVLMYGCTQGPDAERPDGAGGCRGAPSVVDDTAPSTCPTGLVLSEVMSSPGAGADYEWLEIYNASGEPQDLHGLNIVREGSSTSLYEPGITLQPGAYAVLAKGEDPDVPADYIYSNLTLTDSEANLCLYCDGEVIDCIDYGDTSKGTAWSLSPSALDADDNDNVDNWCAATTEWANGDFGTPGEENPACPVVLECPETADVVVTEVLPNVAGDEEGEFIEVLNLGDSAVPLSCLRAVDGSSLRELDLVPTTGCDGTLAPDEYLVFARDLSWHEGEDYRACEIGGLTMTNSGERWGVGLETLSGDEVELSVIDCASQDCPTDEGVSAHVDPREPGAEEAGYWCASEDTWGDQLATPGFAGSQCELPEDIDGDGYSSDVDCDDSDNTVYPGAPDSYGDGIDQDCDGSDGQALTLSDLVAGDLWITEAMPDPSAVGDSYGEWVELYNNTDSPVSLDGLDEPCSVSGAVAIEPGGFVVLAKKADVSANGGISGAVECSLSLSNSGKTLSVGLDGALLDSFTYGSASAGVSFQRAYSGGTWYETICKSGSATYGDGDRGTPGDFNTACE